MAETGEEISWARDILRGDDARRADRRPAVFRRRTRHGTATAAEAWEASLQAWLDRGAKARREKDEAVEDQPNGRES